MNKTSGGETMKVENKSFELKTDGISDEGEFFGILSFYDYKDHDNDIVVKGAFTDSILANNFEVVMLWQHDVKQPIGKLQLNDTDIGLEVKGFINMGVEKGREAHALLKQGAIKGLSIGFITEKWNFDQEKSARLLTQLDLKEGSLVTFPCNDRSNVDLASVKAEEIETIENTEDEEIDYCEFDKIISDVKGFLDYHEVKSDLEQTKKFIENRRK
jgi:HK97 family phage prohead protease